MELYKIADSRSGERKVYENVDWISRFLRQVDVPLLRREKKTVKHARNAAKAVIETLAHRKLACNYVGSRRLRSVDDCGIRISRRVITGPVSPTATVRYAVMNDLYLIKR